jgi:hypothetical protein
MGLDLRGLASLATREVLSFSNVTSRYYSGQSQDCTVLAAVCVVRSVVVSLGGIAILRSWHTRILARMTTGPPEGPLVRPKVTCGWPSYFFLYLLLSVWGSYYYQASEYFKTRIFPGKIPRCALHVLGLRSSDYGRQDGRK